MISLTAVQALTSFQSHFGSTRDQTQQTGLKNLHNVHECFTQRGDSHTVDVYTAVVSTIPQQGAVKCLILSKISIDTCIHILFITS